MEPRPIEHYIYLGTSLRFLQDAPPGQKVHGKGWVLANIDEFLTLVERFGLYVTIRACGDLQAFARDLAKLPRDHQLTAEEATRLRGIVRQVRHTLLAEAGGVVAYLVTDKRLDVKKLLGDVRALLAPGIFDSLPELARYDLSQAGRCIAFELPTAAAFHVLRATEGVFRHFYCCFVRRNRAKLLWGPMVDSLRARSHPPSAPLLNNLDNIRDSFRNPTQHPDKIYDIDEVQDLFPLCVDAIDRMVASDKWTNP